MSNRFDELASECERLAIRAADRADGLVAFDGDPAIFLFDLARTLREAEETIRNGPNRATANVAAALADAESSARRRLDEMEAKAEQARKDTEDFLDTDRARAAVDNKSVVTIGDGAGILGSARGLVYAGKVLKRRDGVESLSVSVLCPLDACSILPVGSTVQVRTVGGLSGGPANKLLPDDVVPMAPPVRPVPS